MKNFLICVILFTCAPTHAQKSHSYSSPRPTAPPDKRFLSELLRFSEKGNLYYCLTNDKDNIYVDLKIIDYDVIRQVMRSGLTLWINMDGKKSRKIGLKYPVALDQGTGRKSSFDENQRRTGKSTPYSRNQKQPGPGFEEFAERKVQLANTIELIGFKSGPIKITSFGENDFRGTIEIERDGTMWYEVILPISKLPAMTHMNKEGKESFNLGFEYSEMSFAGARRGPGGPPGGMRPPGGGAMQGSGDRGMRPGGGGGRGGYSGGPPQATETKKIFWLKNITLTNE